MKKVIIIPSLEDIIAINKELEKSFSVNEGALDFMISKINPEGHLWTEKRT